MTAGITVREALSIGGLRRASLVAGRDGLDRVIQYVDVVEVPDVSSWVRKDEIVVTTGYAIRSNDEAQVRLVEILSAGGASGLVVKPERFLGSLPKAMLEVADRASFPVITVPAEIPYIEITHPLLQAIFNRQAQHVQEISSRLMRVMAERGDLSVIAASLHEIGNTPVIICNTSLHVLASAGIDLRIVQLPATAGLFDCEITFCEGQALEGRLAFPGREGVEDTWMVLPIAAGSSKYGYLLFGKDRIQEQYDLVLAVMKNASAILALEFVMRSAVQEAENRAKREIFDGLIQGSLPSGDFGEQAKRLGLDFGANSVVLYGSLGAKSPQSMFQDIKVALDRSGRASVVLRYGDYFLAVLRTEAIAAHEIGPDIHNLLKRELGRMANRLRIGVSGFCRDIAGLPRAYREAREALQVGSVVSAGPVHSFADIGLFEFVGNNPHELLRYCRSVLDPLVSRMSTTKAQTLLSTLETYLDENCSIRATAERLHLHRNTVHNHIRDIRRYLGPDFDRPPRNLTLRFALKILKVAGE